MSNRFTPGGCQCNATVLFGTSEAIGTPNIHALDKNGNLLWEYDLGTITIDQTGANGEVSVCGGVVKLRSDGTFDNEVIFPNSWYVNRDGTYKKIPTGITSAKCSGAIYISWVYGFWSGVGTDVDGVEYCDLKMIDYDSINRLLYTIYPYDNPNSQTCIGHNWIAQLDEDLNILQTYGATLFNSNPQFCFIPSFNDVPWNAGQINVSKDGTSVMAMPDGLQAIKFNPTTGNLIWCSGWTAYTIIGNLTQGASNAPMILGSGFIYDYINDHLVFNWRYSDFENNLSDVVPDDLWCVATQDCFGNGLGIGIPIYKLAYLISARNADLVGQPQNLITVNPYAWTSECSLTAILQDGGNYFFVDGSFPSFDQRRMSMCMTQTGNYIYSLDMFSCHNLDGYCPPVRTYETQYGLVSLNTTTLSPFVLVNVHNISGNTSTQIPPPPQDGMIHNLAAGKTHNTVVGYDTYNRRLASFDPIALTPLWHYNVNTFVLTTYVS